FLDSARDIPILLFGRESSRALSCARVMDSRPRPGFLPVTGLEGGPASPLPAAPEALQEPLLVDELDAELLSLLELGAGVLSRHRPHARAAGDARLARRHQQIAGRDGLDHQPGHGGTAVADVHRYQLPPQRAVLGRPDR